MPFDRQRFVKASIGVIGPLLTPVILLGGILSGIFTPTEAASVAVAFMLVLGVHLPHGHAEGAAAGAAGDRGHHRRASCSSSARPRCWA